MTIAEIGDFVKNIERMSESISGKCEFNEIKETFVRNLNNTLKGISQNVYTAARKRDRGGNSMNLISELLVKFDFNDKRRRYKTEANKKIDDYGYVLYQSMEYDFKYLKNDDFGFRRNLLNTNIR